MLQLDAISVVVLAAGSSGTGKSTFALRSLVADTDLTCRFIFDPEGEFAERLQLPAAETMDELEFAIDDGFCIFDPHWAFRGNMAGALAWFSEYVFEKSCKLPGRKIFFISEAWKYCSPNSIPQSLANCVQTGRKAGLGMLFDTQRPNRLNESITNEVSELVCFRLQGRKALERVEELGADPSEVSSLPDGCFVSLNTKSLATVRGRLW
jgi:hypothetical protein